MIYLEKAESRQPLEKTTQTPAGEEEKTEGQLKNETQTEEKHRKYEATPAGEVDSIVTLIRRLLHAL
ncbi:unnamed protein product [Caretta caretta]